MKDYVTIFGSEGPLTNGTKVLLPDGSEISGVYKIELTGGVNELWTAVISCHAKLDRVNADGFIIESLAQQLKHHKEVAEDKIRKALDEYHQATSLIPVRIDFDLIDSRSYGSAIDSTAFLVGTVNLIANS